MQCQNMEGNIPVLNPIKQKQKEEEDDDEAHGWNSNLGTLHLQLAQCLGTPVRSQACFLRGLI